MKIKIEKGVPIPKSEKELDDYNQYLMEMDVGESFKFPYKDRPKVLYRALRLLPKKFKTLTVKNNPRTCRIWRTE